MKRIGVRRDLLSSFQLGQGEQAVALCGGQGRRLR